MSEGAIIAIVAVVLIFGIPVLVLLIPIVAVIGGLAVGAVKAWRSGIDRKTREQIKEETKMVQEIHAQLSKMEERVEVLEAILLEHEKRREEARQ